MVKDWGLALAITGFVFLGWNFLRARPPSSGEAPAFTLVDVQGNDVSLEELRGETVVLNFWATWCQPCRQEIPDLSAFQDEHPEVRVLGISVDEAITTNHLRSVSKRFGITYQVLHDPTAKVSHAYQVNGLPTTFVVDEEGKIKSAKAGPVSKQKLERMVFR